MATTNQEARLNVRLDSQLKKMIEEASAALGQTVSEFTVSTLVKEARQVIQETQFTQLSQRDRDTFLAALDATNTIPNDALKTAAKRYKEKTK